MDDKQHVAVVDIGKTNVKLALIEMETLTEVAVLRQPNPVLPGPPYPHFDIEALWNFILTGLTQLQLVQPINAITVTTHGASAALLDGEGKLAAPVLDYEHDGPDGLADEYDAVRPDFQETGSPRLPVGLNLGAQIYWLFETFPDIKEKARFIVTYPQYWVARLTGIIRNEVTSLGCHTDLWCPTKGSYSTMVERSGWLALMPPLCQPNQRIGPIRAAVAEQTDLDKQTSVYSGIHDSNASLYPHLLNRDSPFSVVSTGTWVVCMAVGGKPVILDPTRDTLINVNGLGDPVMSSRFMGGREFEVVVKNHSQTYQQHEVKRVLEEKLMLLPSVEPGSGPFQGQKHRWIEGQQPWSDGERFIAVSFYLALMTATCLDLIGALGDTIVEGPFSNNALFCDMLAAATGRPVIATSGTGTSAGAALLIAAGRASETLKLATVFTGYPTYSKYAQSWLSTVAVSNS
ncbi:MAG: carbohydrate kinase [Rhizobiaceae bacterium]|nr:carbohydrate kinase [Rhizobiaceae bacterium]